MCNEDLVLQAPRVPKTVALEILWGCNLRCRYCYVGEKANWDHPVVPDLNSLKTIISILRAAGVEELFFVGGEPLAYPKFRLLCEHANAIGFPVRGVCTNGTLITLETAKLLQSLSFYVDVSIRGGNEAAFDSHTRVPGSYSRVLEGLRNLKRVGLKVGIEYDCTPTSADELYSLVASLVQDGIEVNQVFLHRIMLHGDAAGLPDEDLLNFTAYDPIFLQASQIERELGIRVAFEDGFPMCLTDPVNWKHIVPCECGRNFATVDPTGCLRRCSCHPKALGSILKTELAMLWGEKLRDFRGRKWLHEECKKCSLLDVCGGGCASSGASPIGYGQDRFANAFKAVVGDGQVKPRGIFGQDILGE